MRSNSAKLNKNTLHSWQKYTELKLYLRTLLYYGQSNHLVSERWTSYNSYIIWWDWIKQSCIKTPFIHERSTQSQTLVTGSSILRTIHLVSEMWTSYNSYITTIENPTVRTLKFVLWVPLSMRCHCISLKGKRRHAQGVKILDVQAAGPKWRRNKYHRLELLGLLRDQLCFVNHNRQP